MVSPNYRVSRSLVVLFLLIFLTALDGIGPVGAGESAPPQVKIHVWPALSIEPANLLVQTIVERNPDNRLMRIIADSGMYFSSSEIQLEGDRSARVRSVVLRSLPAGDYEVRTEVFGFDGRIRARARATVIVSGRFGALTIPEHPLLSISPARIDVCGVALRRHMRACALALGA
jgi:hypothetical protein